MKRILIFGGVGAGKTTFARKISDKLRIPIYITDDMVYKIRGKEKFTEKWKCGRLKSIAKKKKWIIEGVHGGEWLIPAIKKAELIILLDFRKSIRFKRTLLKYFGKRDEGQLELRHLPKFLYWAYEYDKKDRIKHQDFIRKYKKKFVILKNDREAKEFLENI